MSGKFQGLLQYKRFYKISKGQETTKKKTLSISLCRLFFGDDVPVKSYTTQSLTFPVVTSWAVGGGAVRIKGENTAVTFTWTCDFINTETHYIT